MRCVLSPVQRTGRTGYLQEIEMSPGESRKGVWNEDERGEE